MQTEWTLKVDYKVVTGQSNRTELLKVNNLGKIFQTIE